MPRKAFVADLQDVLRHFRSPNISGLKAGGEDGSVTFQYKVPEGSAANVTVQAFVPGEHVLFIISSQRCLIVGSC